MGSCPQNCVSRPGGGSEEFSRNSSKSPGQLVDVLLIGWWGGNQQSASSAFWVHRVWGLRAVGSMQLTSPTWRGFQYLQNSSKTLRVYPLRGDRQPAPRLHYCFLTAPPLSLHPLPSLISNCLNLPVGTQGRSWRLNEAYFL